MGDGWGNGRYVAAAVSRITMRADVKSVLCESPVLSGDRADIKRVRCGVCCRQHCVLQEPDSPWATDAEIG